MLFPGQGSQSVGMLSELASAFSIVGETYAEASEVFGRDLWQLSSEGSPEQLAQTELTQPLMLVAGVAVWRCWLAADGSMPTMLAGHSLGEYSALVAADAIDFSDAVHVVAERARLMQSAVPAGEGAMAAILGLEDEIVEAICRESAENAVVSAANYNSPGQLVIAGDSAAVERATHACLDAGARKVLRLPVSVPSHCALMAPAATALETVLAGIEIRPPKLPVLHNVDVATRSDPAAIREALVAQLCAPVRWTASVRKISEADLTVMGECGPGRILCGLGRRIDRQLSWIALDTPSGLEELSARLT